MNRIKIQDIDFSSLNIMKHQGSKSIIYEDDDMCYKMFNLDHFYSYELKILERKLIDMSDILIDGVYLPIDLIMDNENLIGIILKKFKNSVSLYEKFSGKLVDFKELFNYITKASNILRELHNHKVICQDLSFDNILVDNNGNIAFCDLDGCSYYGYDSPFIAMPMKKLICMYRGENFIACENFDKISMLVSLYYLIYNKYLYNIPKTSIDNLSSKVLTIKKTLPYIDDLLDKKRIIPDVPYLDELIVPEDDYVFDRQKEFNILRRILKK